MATRRHESGAYWWWSRGGGVSQRGGGMSHNRWLRHELQAIAGYHLHEFPVMPLKEAPPPPPPPGPYQRPGNQSVYSDILQMSNPKRRLRWTRELHEKFVNAIDQLGGASKATPKKIANLMCVNGLTLFQIKSHLQKFRLGKTAKPSSKREFSPSDSGSKEDEKLQQPVNLESHGSSAWNSFDGNIGNKTVGADIYENLHLLVESQTAVKNQEMVGKASAITLNQQAGPSVMTALNFEHEDVAPYHFHNLSIDDYLNPFVCSSPSEFASTKSHESGRANVALRSVLNEIACFLNVDYD